MSELPTQEDLNEQEQILLQLIALQAIQKHFNDNNSGENNTSDGNFLEEFEKRLREETKEAEANVVNYVRTFVEGGKDSSENELMRETIYQQAQENIYDARQINKEPEPVDQLIVSIYDEFINKLANTQTTPDTSGDTNEVTLADSEDQLIKDYNTAPEDQKNGPRTKLENLLALLEAEEDKLSEMAANTGNSEPLDATYEVMKRIDVIKAALNPTPNINTQTTPDTSGDTNEVILADINNLDGLLEEHKNATGADRDAIEARLNAALEELQERIDFTGRPTDMSTEEIQAVQAKIDAIQAALNPDTQTTPDAGDSHEAVLADINNLDGLLEEHKNATGADRDAIEARLNAALEELQERIDFTGRPTDMSTEEIQAVQAKIDAIKAAIPDTQTQPGGGEKFENMTDEQLAEILSDLEKELKEGILDEETRQKTEKDIELVKNEIAKRKEAAKTADTSDYGLGTMTPEDLKNRKKELTEKLNNDDTPPKEKQAIKKELEAIKSLEAQFEVSFATFNIGDLARLIRDAAERELMAEVNTGGWLKRTFKKVVKMNSAIREGLLQKKQDTIRQQLEGVNSVEELYERLANLDSTSGDSARRELITKLLEENEYFRSSKETREVGTGDEELDVQIKEFLNSAAMEYLNKPNRTPQDKEAAIAKIDEYIRQLTEQRPELQEKLGMNENKNILGFGSLEYIDKLEKVLKTSMDHEVGMRRVEASLENTKLLFGKLNAGPNGELANARYDETMERLRSKDTNLGRLLRNHRTFGLVMAGAFGASMVVTRMLPSTAARFVSIASLGTAGALSGYFARKQAMERFQGDVGLAQRNFVEGDDVVGQDGGTVLEMDKKMHANEYAKETLQAEIATIEPFMFTDQYGDIRLKQDLSIQQLSQVSAIVAFNAARLSLHQQKDINLYSTVPGQALIALNRLALLIDRVEKGLSSEHYKSFSIDHEGTNISIDDWKTQVQTTALTHITEDVVSTDKLIARNKQIVGGVAAGIGAVAGVTAGILLSEAVAEVSSVVSGKGLLSGSEMLHPISNMFNFGGGAQAAAANISPSGNGAPQIIGDTTFVTPNGSSVSVSNGLAELTMPDGTVINDIQIDPASGEVSPLGIDKLAQSGLTVDQAAVLEENITQQTISVDDALARSGGGGVETTVQFMNGAPESNGTELGMQFSTNPDGTIIVSQQGGTAYQGSSAVNVADKASGGQLALLLRNGNTALQFEMVPSSDGGAVYEFAPGSEGSKFFDIIDGVPVPKTEFVQVGYMPDGIGSSSVESISTVVGPNGGEGSITVDVNNPIPKTEITISMAPGGGEESPADIADVPLAGLYVPIWDKNRVSRRNSADANNGGSAEGDGSGGGIVPPAPAPKPKAPEQQGPNEIDRKNKYAVEIEKESDFEVGHLYFQGVYNEEGPTGGRFLRYVKKEDSGNHIFEVIDNNGNVVIDNGDDYIVDAGTWESLNAYEGWVRTGRLRKLVDDPPNNEAQSILTPVLGSGGPDIGQPTDTSTTAPQPTVTPDPGPSPDAAGSGSGSGEGVGQSGQFDAEKLKEDIRLTAEQAKREVDIVKEQLEALDASDVDGAYEAEVNRLLAESEEKVRVANIKMAESQSISNKQYVSELLSEPALAPTDTDREAIAEAKTGPIEVLLGGPDLITGERIKLASGKVLLVLDYIKGSNPDKNDDIVVLLDSDNIVVKIDVGRLVNNKATKYGSPEKGPDNLPPIHNETLTQSKLYDFYDTKADETTITRLEFVGFFEGKYIFIVNDTPNMDPVSFTQDELSKIISSKALKPAGDTIYGKGVLIGRKLTGPNGDSFDEAKGQKIHSVEYIGKYAPEDGKCIISKYNINGKEVEQVVLTEEELSDYVSSRNLEFRGAINTSLPNVAQAVPVSPTTAKPKIDQLEPLDEQRFRQELDQNTADINAGIGGALDELSNHLNKLGEVKSDLETVLAQESQFGPESLFGIKQYSETLKSTNEKHEANEDSILSDPKNGIYGVFDGMGGQGGDPRAAADAAAKAVQEYLADPTRQSPETEDIIKQIMQEAFAKARQAVISNGEGGSTVATAVKIFELPNGKRVAGVAHAGDTRMFIYHSDGTYESITEDQSTTDPRKPNSERRNLVTNGMLAEPSEEYNDKNDEYITVELLPGDRIMICSDGITGDDPTKESLSDDEMKEAFSRATPQEAAQKFVEFSKKVDDKSIVVLDIP